MTTLELQTPIEFITHLGKSAAVCPAYSAEALEHLRQVYVLARSEDPRWRDFLKLWAETDGYEDDQADVRIYLEMLDAGSRPIPVEDGWARAPKLTKPESDGMYRNPGTGEIFKVQVAVHGSGKLYAKQLIMFVGGEKHFAPTKATAEMWEPGRDSMEFQYVQGAIYRLDASWKMSLEEAKAFGALYGTCCVCGRTLTDEKSIAAGIGPVCAEKF
jgi:hypothetical protein